MWYKKKKEIHCDVSSDVDENMLATKFKHIQIS